MTLNLDLNPQEEAWLSAQSAQQGVPPREIIKRMIDERLAPGTVEPEVIVPAAVEPPSAPVIDAKAAAAIAFLDTRIAEGIAADPETRRLADEELEEFKRNMNANRAAAGERLVYP